MRKRLIVDNELNTIEDLIFAFEDFLDERIRSQKFPTVFEKKGLKMDKEMKILVRRNLLLIFKEAVMNALKHTELSKLEIQLENGSSSFKMQIINEFTKTKEVVISSGRGLKNMKNRAAHINGVLTTESTGNQFEVQLVLNYPI